MKFLRVAAENNRKAAIHSTQSRVTANYSTAFSSRNQTDRLAAVENGAKAAQTNPLSALNHAPYQLMTLFIIANILMRIRQQRLRIIAVFTLLLAAVVQAEPLRVATAANFAAPAQALAQIFEQQQQTTVTIVLGSSGKLYAQIMHGAPYDVFFSADKQKPQALIDAKMAVEGSKFTYAIGQLVLWSPSATVSLNQDTLRNTEFNRLAIANPKLAPYGLAAQQLLTYLGLWPSIQPRLVQGENIAQTYQFVSSGNTELGLIAMSQVMNNHQISSGVIWPVPAELYAPIAQDAVLINRTQLHPVAAAFLDFVKSPAAQRIIGAFGYSVPPS